MGFKPSRRWMQSYGNLYGENILEVPKPRKKRQRGEEIEQEAFKRWADEIGLPWFHPPMGGSRNAIEGVKFKRMGAKSGIPDIVVLLSRSSYHGLVIELKRLDGKISDVSTNQRLWLNWFSQNGFKSCVAFGFIKARAFVEAYIGNEPINAVERWTDDKEIESVLLHNDVCR